MDNLFFLYDSDGNPSTQAYTAEELRAKGVQPNDIVCKKYDTPRRAFEYPELDTLFDWQPEKLTKKDMKALNTRKVRNIVVASLLGATTITGGYFAVTSNAKSAMTSEEIARLESDKQKLEDSLKQIENYNRNLIVQEQKLTIEIANIESQKIELEKHRINSTNEIGKISVDFSANKRKYDEAEEKSKKLWCVYDCKKNAEENMKYYDEAMKRHAKTILDYQKAIAQDSLVLVSNTTQYESAKKNLDEIQKRKNENERQLKDLRIRGDTLNINLNQLRALMNTNPR